jgi:hypothetical protein
VIRIGGVLDAEHEAQHRGGEHGIGHGQPDILSSCPVRRARDTAITSDQCESAR